MLLIETTAEQQIRQHQRHIETQRVREYNWHDDDDGDDDDHQHDDVWCVVENHCRLLMMMTMMMNMKQLMLLMATMTKRVRNQENCPLYYVYTDHYQQHQHWHWPSSCHTHTSVAATRVDAYPHTTSYISNEIHD
jgi:hypothetical protein